MPKSTNPQINKSTIPQAEVLVRVEGVSKKFCKDLKRSLWYGLQDITSELFGLMKKEGLRKDEFWAVSDISFELKRGECLGLIGHNGAGKSTLLKMLNGLIKPDKGRITMKGRIGALIELGAGFNPILTGRENVFNNGAVLGFTQEEIAKKYNAIVEFAELEEFMDTPVQNYSSGMKVRLGFAVAAQMEPDVLIIDEVLAVGDVGFSFKCLNKIFDLSNSCAIILVSHDMSKISRVANSIILLKDGIKLAHEYDVNIGVEKYFGIFQNSETSKGSTSMVNLEFIKLTGSDERYDSSDVPIVQYLDTINLKLRFRISSDIKYYTINIAFRDIGQRLVAQSFMTDGDEKFNKNSGETTEVTIKFPNAPFSLGVFKVDLNFREYHLNSKIEKRKYLGNFRNISTFMAQNPSGFSNAPIKLISNYSIKN